MTKVVYNGSYGGFSFSDKAKKWLCEHGVKNPYKVERHNPILVQCVEELGTEANGYCADICIEEINGNKYWIEEYDGFEVVYTPDTIDWVVIRDDVNRKSTVREDLIFLCNEWLREVPSYPINKEHIRHILFWLEEQKD